MNYQCGECGREFKKKSTYDRHINIKYKCNWSIKCKDTGKYKCFKCGKSMNSHRGVIRHLKNSCPIIREEEEQKRIADYHQTLKNHLEDLEELMKDPSANKREINKMIISGDNVDASTGKHINSHNTQNINNTQHNTHNNNVTININRFGEEDVSHITSEVVNELLKKGFDCYAELMRLIHYNVDKPQNHNLIIDKKYNNEMSRK